jgi:diaminopimelate decarboxylase
MPIRRSSPAAAAWWSRPGLDFVQGDLQLGGHSLAGLARRHGTPLYVYDGTRVRDNLGRLQAALAVTGLNTRVFYAMKSNRFTPLLASLHALGRCGIDTCSPAEVRHARAAGFAPEQISFTGTSLSDADLRDLLRHDGLIL